MADAGPPQAADTPCASPEVGPDPLDADALRNLQRLLDDGEIDADEFERRKAEALGLAEKTATAGALSRLPEDMLQNVLSFLVLKQDGIAQRFLENVRVMQRRVSGLLEIPGYDDYDEAGDEHLFYALDLIGDGDVCAKKLREDIESSLTPATTRESFCLLYTSPSPRD